MLGIIVQKVGLFTQTISETQRWYRVTLLGTRAGIKILLMAFPPAPAGPSNNCLGWFWRRVFLPVIIRCTNFLRLFPSPSFPPLPSPFPFSSPPPSSSYIFFSFSSSFIWDTDGRFSTIFYRIFKVIKKIFKRMRCRLMGRFAGITYNLSLGKDTEVLAYFA